MPERGVWAKAAIRIDPRTRTITRAATALSSGTHWSATVPRLCSKWGKSDLPFWHDARSKSDVVSAMPGRNWTTDRTPPFQSVETNWR
jgi:hypothetical protein